MTFSLRMRSKWLKLSSTKWWICGSKKLQLEEWVTWCRSGTKFGRKKIKLKTQEVWWLQKSFSSRKKTSSSKKVETFLKEPKSWLKRTKFRRLSSVWKLKSSNTEKTLRHGGSSDSFSRRTTKTNLRSLPSGVHTKLTPTILKVFFHSEYQAPMSLTSRRPSDISPTG